VEIACQPISVVSNRYQPLSTQIECDAERRLLTHEQNSEKGVKTIRKERKEGQRKEE
jgi:hypothetical protein